MNLRDLVLRKVHARMLSFVVIALVLVAGACWGRGSVQQAVANLSLIYAAILMFWNWRLDVAERKR